MDRAALPAGSWLGEVELVRVLAVGGFGIVYLGHDHSLGRDVAIKEFMPAHLVERHAGLQVILQSRANPVDYAQGLQAFMREARLLASISHPSVVKVYRLWEGNGTGYMAMPYLRGPTLGDIRRSMSEPPTERWLRSVIDPLLDALALMHAAGVCHRDIAPDNVVMPADGPPVLLDFGAARRLDARHTRPVTAVLKPCYAPIEQYADEAAQLRQGPWTDLYALGALVMFLIDGKPPPSAPSRCVHDAIDPLARRRIAGISTRFLEAIDWALRLKPQDRPQSVQALRDALTAARRPATATAAAPRTLPQRLVPRASWWLPTAFGGVLAAMVFTPWSALGTATLPDPGAAARAPAAPVVLPQTVAETVVPASLSRPPEMLAATAEMHAPARPARQRGPARKRVAAAPQVAVLGPTELCAARNFFLRPYCVQRQCDAPRFARRAECIQLRSVARYGREGHN